MTDGSDHMGMILASGTPSRQGSSDIDMHYSDLPPDCDSNRPAYSLGWKPLPGTCQPRCSPPSSAIICPVIDGALKM